MLEPKELRKIGDFILYGIAAADEALADSGWQPETDEERNATGVMIGSGIGGIDGIAENALIPATIAARAASARSSFPATSSIWFPARCRSATASRDRTMRW